MHTHAVHAHTHMHTVLPRVARVLFRQLVFSHDTGIVHFMAGANFSVQGHLLGAFLAGRAGTAHKHIISP